MTLSILLDSLKEDDGKVIGTDQVTDLALVKVNDLYNLESAKLGNSEDIQVAV